MTIKQKEEDSVRSRIIQRYRNNYPECRAQLRFNQYTNDRGSLEQDLVYQELCRMAKYGSTKNKVLDLVITSCFLVTIITLTYALIRGVI